MGKILDLIGEINAKNILANKPQNKLTRQMFERILRGLISERSHKLLADELSISRELIVDVVQEFEIDHSGKARRLLNDLADEKDENIPTPKWLEQKHKPMPKIKEIPSQTKPKPVGLYNKEEVEKRFKVQQSKVGGASKIPTDLQHKFKEDILFGFRRMQVVYGDGSDLDLSFEELKSEIIRIKPDILTTDSKYFEDRIFSGDENGKKN